MKKRADLHKRGNLRARAAEGSAAVMSDMGLPILSPCQGSGCQVCPAPPRPATLSMFRGLGIPCAVALSADSPRPAPVCARILVPRPRGGALFRRKHRSIASAREVTPLRLLGIEGSGGTMHLRGGPPARFGDFRAVESHAGLGEASPGPVDQQKSYSEHPIWTATSVLTPVARDTGTDSTPCSFA